MKRLDDIITFYKHIDLLNEICGRRTLANCHGRLSWPKRGVYFFFENDEQRKESGNGLRVVRIGTHAVSNGSKTTIWQRLSQHRGSINNTGGNHRGSIFRQIIGNALSIKDPHITCETWLDKNISKDDKNRELYLEQMVSDYIQKMPFLWVEIDDTPSKESKRAYIERNAIALLSNYNSSIHDSIDLPSSSWLGLYSYKDEIRSSGLWNSNHVKEEYNPDFLILFKKYIIDMQNSPNV